MTLITGALWVAVYVASATSRWYTDPAWIAFLGAALGGVGLKLIEHWLGSSRVKINDATVIRDELRKTVNENKEEIKELEAAVNEWRQNYYDMRDKYIEDLFTKAYPDKEFPIKDPPDL